MVDIHTHCLPGMDDGAQDVFESVAMLKESYRQGVRLCVATPHCTVHREGDIDAFLTVRQECYHKLMNALGEEKAAIPQLMLGGEVYMDRDLSEHVDIGKLCIGETPYMLVELSRRLPKQKKAEVLYNLTRMGIKPIVAHVERYDDWQELLQEFSDLRLVYQVNAENFLSFGGKSFLKTFMKYNLPFIVSSDMHNMTSRPCNMEKAYQKAWKKYGELAEQLFKKNAAEKLL